MTIRILPAEVASAIAAGEVVERPVSVVKELMENSLDAGARRIEIEVLGGGSQLIEVADDGEGIAADELPLAVARFATSKLETAKDLFRLSSLGFRGEALSSIGAISRLEITSRRREAAHATRLSVEGGHSGALKPIGAPTGTVVRVRDLFFNVPARREFLKSESTERQRISDLVTRYAVAYPQVAFRLTQEGRQTFQSSGSGDRREALAAVFGLELGRSMLDLPQDARSEIQVEGFISPPAVHRSNRRGLTFFVNGRWVQDASLSAAVVQAYHSLLMVGRYPLALVLIEMPAEAVDVNVHPSKTEVRFKTQNQVFSAVQRLVRATLLGQTAPSINFQPSWGGGAYPATTLLDVERAGSSSPLPGFTPMPTQPGLGGRALPLLRAVGQIGSTYLVAEGPDGLYLVDQHAAHERVLYERLLAAADGDQRQSQVLLQPEMLTFSAAQSSFIEERLEGLRGLGFDIEPFGGNAFRVRALPGVLSGLSAALALQAVIDEIEEDEKPLAAEMERLLAARICKRAAVKGGQVLSMAEQQQLLQDLEGCQAPRTCPHGRPTMIHLSVDALEKQFGRQG